MKTATSAAPRKRARIGSVPARSLARRKNRAKGDFIWLGKPGLMRIDIAARKVFGEVIHNLKKRRNDPRITASKATPAKAIELQTSRSNPRRPSPRRIRGTF